MSRWRHYCLRLSLVVLRFMALDQPTLKRLAHLVYDVRRDDAPLRKVAGIPVNLINCVKIILSAVNGRLYT